MYSQLGQLRGVCVILPSWSLCSSSFGVELAKGIGSQVEVISTISIRALWAIVQLYRSFFWMCNGVWYAVVRCLQSYGVTCTSYCHRHGNPPPHAKMNDHSASASMLIAIMTLHVTEPKSTKGPWAPWYCRVLKGAGSQSVVRCVSTISDRSNQQVFFFLGSNRAGQSCSLVCVYLGYAVPSPWCTKCVFGFGCAVCVLVSTGRLWTPFPLSLSLEALGIYNNLCSSGLVIQITSTCLPIPGQWGNDLFRHRRSVNETAHVLPTPKGLNFNSCQLWTTCL